MCSQNKLSFSHSWIPVLGGRCECGVLFFFFNSCFWVRFTCKLFSHRRKSDPHRGRFLLPFRWYVLSCLVISDSLRHPRTVACHALSVEFSRQEYWIGLLIPTPGDDSGV